MTEAQPARGRSLVPVWALTGLVALVALATAFAVHQACFHPPVPFERPDPGTERAGYCEALQATDPWISLTVLPSLAMLAGGLLLRRRPRVAMALAALICAALVANALVANDLDYATPFY